MTLNEIKIAIRNGNFTNEDLITLGSYIQNVKTEQAKASISVGDEVFVVQKTKKTKGIVEKIKFEYIFLDDNNENLKIINNHFNFFKNFCFEYFYNDKSIQVVISKCN